MSLCFLLLSLTVTVCAGQSEGSHQTSDASLETRSSQCSPVQVFVNGASAGVTMNDPSLLSAIQEKVAALERRLDAVQQPIGFTVRTTQEDMTGLTLNQVIVFDDVITNLGGGYDSSTGNFTAPASGTYVFFIEMLNHNNLNKVFFDIMKNSGVMLVRAHAGWSKYESGSSLGVTHLDEGETITVRISYGNAFWGGRYTTFSGFRVTSE